MTVRVSYLSRLKEHRQRRGLTQIELSKISEVSRATIADLEAGKRGAYRSTLKKLARALKVKPPELMKGEEWRRKSSAVTDRGR